MEQAISEVMDGSSFEGNWTVIGVGGFGHVFKARHRQLGKDVAVKLVEDDGSSSKALAREAKLMQSADSPYIMRTLGVFRGCIPGSDVILVGLVMDLMEGGSLESLQKKREREPLPWALVFRMVHQVAEGMKYLHSLTPALIHKDLKPDNILLDKDLNVKVTDFDIAKFDNTVTTPSLRGRCTAFYAPPESQKVGATTPAYDVYSYAVLVWTILNPAYIIGRHLQSYPVRPSLEDVRRMKAPGLMELVDLMERCWKQDPKERPTFAECTAVTERLYEMNKSGINAAIVQLKLEQDGVILKKPKRDFQHLTLDTNTASKWLSLSENNRRVTRDGQRHSYPDHNDRFDYWNQVLCSESLTGRCYWEVEWSGKVDIAVTYRGISRKGSGHYCWLGCNDKSWKLTCRGDGYAVRHNNEETLLPVSSSNVSTRVDEDGNSVSSGRVAVYLDHPAGTLSFYEVSSDTLTHLYTFQTTFTEPLYAGFTVGQWGGSVCLFENAAVVQVKLEQDGVVILKEPKRDFQRLTLDTNITHRKLSLSENNRKVTRDGQDHSYPDHNDRFDYWLQVLCSESLTGRCYWEVEWSGYEVDIAVTYRGISRKGDGYDCLLGWNDKSWKLTCRAEGYYVVHNDEQTILPVSSSNVSTRVDEWGHSVYSGRVAVYLDHPAGTLSFYEVSSDTLTHLYTFQSTFTEPLYAGFRVGCGSVRLCEQR